MLDLNDRQMVMLNLAIEKKLSNFTRKDVNVFSVGEKTLTRDLKELVDLKLIDLFDKTYRLNYKNPDLCEFMLLNNKNRKNEKKGYDFDIIEKYIPNQTFWLDDIQIGALNNVNQLQFSVGDELYRKVINTLLIDLTYASSRFENVNITLIETRTLLEYGEKPDGIDSKNIKLVLNHKDAIQYLLESKGSIPLTKMELCNIHHHLMNGLLSDTTSIGQLRARPVIIDGSTYVPLSITSQLDEQLCKILDKASHIENVHEQAFFLMTMLSYLQAFEDGNKRVSRLTMNIPYLNNNLIPFSFITMKKSHYHLGLLMFYEYGRTDVLADVFVKSYIKGAEKYTQLLEHVYNGGIIATLG